MPPTATAPQRGWSVPPPGWAQSRPSALQPTLCLFSINAQLRGELGFRAGLSFIRKEAWPLTQPSRALQEPLTLTQKKPVSQSPARSGLPQGWQWPSPLGYFHPRWLSSGQ